MQLRIPTFWTSMALTSIVFTLSVLLTISWYGSKTTLPSSVTVEDWSVGGMPIQEFERQLAWKKELLLGQKVQLVAAVSGGQPLIVERTLGQLGLVVSDGHTVEKLMPLKEGSLFRRAVYRWQQRGGAWTIERTVAEDKLRASLQEALQTLYTKKPVDAKRFVRGDDTIGYTPEVKVERVDEGKLLTLLGSLLPAWGSAEMQAGIERCRGGESGCGEGSQPVTVQVPLYWLEPQVTVASLQAQGIVRKLTEFSTSYPPGSAAVSSEGRIHNVRSTAASIHDVVLKPGEVFDYATYIEQTEKKFGFREAPVILNGKLVPGIGGGICQVSSTLYNAVLRAGLAIVERRNHSLPVSYVPLGQDATFASGHINFKFRNSTQHHLLIRTASDDVQVTVKLFGQMPGDVTYEVESKLLETLQPPVKYVHNPTLKVGKQEIITQGKAGYVVETYRIKKQNGTVVGQERISKDTYSAQPTVIAVNNGGDGAKSGEPAPNADPRGPMIEDGVKGPTFR
jgi:vancomycin resistance protein YoaR